MLQPKLAMANISTLFTHFSQNLCQISIKLSTGFTTTVKFCEFIQISTTMHGKE